MRLFLALAISSILFAGDASAQYYRGIYGDYLHFRSIRDPALFKFAVSFYRKDEPKNDEFKGKRGLKLFRTYLKFAEADINDDGVPELFLIIESPYFCGTAGCSAQIFRKTPAGYELICDSSLGGADAILPDKDHGYHQIEAPQAILHWEESQEFNAGTLCQGEEHFRSYSTSP